MIEQELGNLLPFERPFATLLTMIEVDPDDPAFHDPTKFVGPVYDKAAADKLAAEKAAKDKAAAAEKAYKDAGKAADAELAKKPANYDGAIKAYTDAKAAVAGSPFEKKVTSELADLGKAKEKALADAKVAGDKAAKDKAAADKAAADKAAKDKVAADKAAADKAAADKAAADKAAKDKVAADKAAADKAAKDKAAADKAAADKAVADKAAKSKVKPVTEALAAKSAEETKSAEEAWTKAGEAEKAVGKPERERLTAALPYYLAVVKARDAEGRFDINAPAAALRIAEIVDKYADNTGESLAAAKFYLVAASLDLGSDAWEKAEKPFVKAGKGFEFAQVLKKLSANAAARGADLAASADADDKALAAKFRKFSDATSKRADSLAAKYAPKS
jgi:hypothetical protein